MHLIHILKNILIHFPRFVLLKRKEKITLRSLAKNWINFNYLDPTPELIIKIHVRETLLRYFLKLERNKMHIKLCR